jgi:hypothetical protein
MQSFLDNSIEIEMSNGWLDRQNPIAFSYDSVSIGANGAIISPARLDRP